jgi:hypothetical protein
MEPTIRSDLPRPTLVDVQGMLARRDLLLPRLDLALACRGECGHRLADELFRACGVQCTLYKVGRYDVESAKYGHVVSRDMMMA